MAFLSLTYVVLCLSIQTGMGKIELVDYTPILTPYGLSGKLTTNTATLTQPSCYFDNVTSLLCNSVQCEIWLVSAINEGITNFDADKTNPDIVSLSPYPTAFSSKNYFLTLVGVKMDFPCPPTSATGYFRVGAEGSCSTTNCNGELPVGSTARFKYLLINPSNGTVLAETQWSDDIPLYYMKDPSTINDSLVGRWASMIVIISILCVAVALLLLLLLAMLIYACCCRQEKQTIQNSDSLSIRKYDTHHFRDQVNPAYQGEMEGFSRLKAETPTSSQNPVNLTKLKSGSDNDLPKAKPATEL
ncbi:uroplakin-3b [Osmerus eperlanus]|uniref:uroplakin-3b n=1 Tax=Osmerus eperlanus TaxID=29151 RepID=UPI002E0E3B03